MAGRMISGAAALAELVRAAGETETAGLHRTLPVAPELSPLLPGHGLRRGSTVAVATGQHTFAAGQHAAAGSTATAAGGTSLLLALLSEASRQGSWCAVVGVPSLGAIAAAESGIALDRLALVPDPGPEWPTVVAALIDGVDLIVLAVPGGVSASIASRLVARARQRGSVLVPYGDWSGADVTLRVVDAHWEGLDEGHGRLRRRRMRVLARGRGAAARPKEITMWLPGVTIRPLTLPPTPSRTSTMDHLTHPRLAPANTPQSPSSPAASVDRPAQLSAVPADSPQSLTSPAESVDRPAQLTAVSANSPQSSAVNVDRPVHLTAVSANSPQPSAVSVDQPAQLTAVVAGGPRPAPAGSVDRPVQLALVSQGERAAADEKGTRGRGAPAESDVVGDQGAGRVPAVRGGSGSSVSAPAVR